MPFKIGHIPKHKGRDSRKTGYCLFCKKQFSFYERKNHDIQQKTCSLSCRSKLNWKLLNSNEKNLSISRMVNAPNRASKIKKVFQAIYIGHLRGVKKDSKKYKMYTYIHQWVRSKLGKPDTCSRCLKNGLHGHKIHWSNISGKYKKEISDWRRLCVPCHKLVDRIIK